MYDKSREATFFKELSATVCTSIEYLLGPRTHISDDVGALLSRAKELALAGLHHTKHPTLRHTAIRGFQLFTLQEVTQPFANALFSLRSLRVAVRDRVGAVLYHPSSNSFAQSLPALLDVPSYEIC